MWARSETFWVRVDHSDRVARLRLTGRFDAGAILHLDGKFADIGDRNVVLDLSGLTYMDGAAWLAVMSYEHRVREAGHHFRLENAFGAIRRIFESTETEYLFSEAAS